MQGAYIAEAGLDPVTWIQVEDRVLSLFAIAVAEHIYEARAARQKEAEGK